jgi:predicted nucleic acid-binding protein
MAGYVVDASVAVKWLVTENYSQEAAALLTQGHALIAPELMFVEVASALWSLRRRQILTAEEVHGALGDLELAPVAVTVNLRQLVPAAARLALDLSHPIYDCVYLALSLQADFPVITADERFFAAVRDHPYLSKSIVMLGGAARTL